jgi:Xaa-Pro aminopeptidase
MASASEIAEKERRVRALMAERGLDAVLLSRQANFAWFTCGGDNHVGIATETGVAHLLITADRKWALCENIEAHRIMEEELDGQGFECRSYPWWQEGLAQTVRDLSGDGAVGCDLPHPGCQEISAQLAPLRYELTPEEVERYRVVGAAVGQALGEVARAIKPGMTEHAIASDLAARLLPQGIVPVVLLIATDDRVFRYRHPIPTDRRLEKHAMLVVCGRKWGLIVSATRMVHFGKLEAELRRKHEAVAAVDAALIAGTRPGAVAGDVFAAGLAAYRAAGFPDEWQLHHQGGATGYAGRDYRASMKTAERVRPNQAFAWNPSITGTKCEDTIIAAPEGPEIISASPGFPTRAVQAGDAALVRPEIMVR